MHRLLWPVARWVDYLLVAGTRGCDRKMISGMVFLGGIPDDKLPASALVRNKTPISFMHGSADSVYSHETQRAVFEAIRAKFPGYPAKFQLLNGGSHGSPIRMVDWKLVISEMLAPF